MEGTDMTGKVQEVFLRGQRVATDGTVVGTPNGRYLARPYEG